MALAFRLSDVDKVFINIGFEDVFSLGNTASIGAGETIYFLPNCQPNKAGLEFIDHRFVLEQTLFRIGHDKLLSINIHDKDSGEILHSESLTFHHSFFVPFFDFARNERIPPFRSSDYNKPEFLAVFTHVYNDNDMLTVWENHYSQLTQHRHMYVIDHSSTTSPREHLNDATNIVTIPRGDVDHVNIAGFCNYFQRFLLTQYMWVIHVDCDELLIYENGAQAFLSKLAATAPRTIIKPKYAYDVVHDYRSEPPIVNSKPASLQRSILKTCPNYRKPAIASVPTSWEPGFHYAFEQDAVVEDESLWMIHLAYADLEKSLEKEKKWKNLPLSTTDMAFVPQTDREETITGIKRKFDRLMEKDGTEMPQWMRGMF